MAIDKEIKRKVTDEWLKAFPALSALSPTRLCKIVGSCIAGIELIRSPFEENYRPYFMMYPLWKKDIDANLDFPIVLMEFKNKKGFQFKIPYEVPCLLLNDALDTVKRDMPLPIDRDISLKGLMSVFDEYSKTPPLSAAPTSYLQALLQEAKLKISLFVAADEAKKVFDIIKKRDWDAAHFKVCGVDVDVWLGSLRDVINNREGFLAQIETIKGMKKISRLKYARIVK